MSYNPKKKVLREKVIGVSVSKHELAKFEQARELAERRLGKSFRRAEFIRYCAMKVADRLITAETEDLRTLGDSE